MYSEDFSFKTLIHIFNHWTILYCLFLNIKYLVQHYVDSLIYHEKNKTKSLKNPFSTLYSGLLRKHLITTSDRCLGGLRKCHVSWYCMLTSYTNQSRQTVKVKAILKARIVCSTKNEMIFVWIRMESRDCKEHNRLNK